MRTLIWLCHAGLIAIVRQLIAALAMILALAIFIPFLSAKGDASPHSIADSFWRSAFAYLAPSFVFLAFGIALTGGKPIDTAADRIARTVATAKKWRSKSILVGLSAQFALGSILFAVLALRPSCEFIQIVCPMKPIYDVLWSVAMSCLVAASAANAHALGKAATRHQ